MVDARPDSSGLRNALVAGPLAAPRIPDRTEGLAEFLGRLDQAYRRIARIDGNLHADRDFGGLMLSLELGRARVDKDNLAAANPGLASQIALLGPTQAGKSSLVNWLLGSDMAEVSPLAGFTVHAHGFCWGRASESLLQTIDRYMHPLVRTAAGTAAHRSDIDTYSVVNVPAAASTLVPDGCLWDTPDFDSVDAGGYRGNLVRVLGLADAIVLVLSKDKYSDQAVWDMLELTEPLAQPVAVVLNKVDESERDVLVASFDEKWRTARSDKVPPIITLPFLDTGEDPSSALLEGIATAVRQRISKIDRVAERKRTRGFLETHWADWLEPVQLEQGAMAEWEHAIAATLERALGHYQREYLDHPHHYETFQRALARLLTMLEVPGVAGVVSATRRALTWPFRQVTNLGRRLRAPADSIEQQSAEKSMLEEIAEHVLLSLDQLAREKRDADSQPLDWWRAIGTALRTEREQADARFRAAHRSYATSFQQEIERTARALYERLEARPVVLNSLRATRITADASALALALHTGGIGIQDFVIAPATLSLTSMLTESALGHYVKQATADLKKRQLAAVRQLLEDCFGTYLRALPERMNDHRSFGLPVADCTAAAARVDAYA